VAETPIDALKIEPTGPCLVGFSGGLDSTVLLHCLAMQTSARARGLRAIHVHHGLHADADAWVAHCEKVCAALDIELIVVHVRVPSDSGLGLEGAAREARQDAFASQLRAGESLVLAHHRNDQAETVLLRLLRASGSDGLAAMREQRAFAGGRLWRPLLQAPRSALLAYAQTHDLRWIEDPSNDDHGLDRNFLRHRVLPVLRERWPQTELALARSAELLGEDAQLLRQEARDRLDQARAADAATLSASALLSLQRPWRARVLREWLSTLRMPALPGRAFEIIDRDLLGAPADARAQYRWAGAVLWRWRDLVHVEWRREALAKDWFCAWSGAGILRLPTGDELQFDSAFDDPAESIDAGAIASRFGSLLVRARQGGERIDLPGRDHSHALKQCLLEAAMPPWIRRRLPLLLADGGAVLAAGDRVVSAPLEHFCRAHSLQLRWRHAAEANAI
jgi:tRNA(Ile)-lysidine synthase